VVNIFSGRRVENGDSNMAMLYGCVGKKILPGLLIFAWPAYLFVYSQSRSSEKMNKK